MKKNLTAWIQVKRSTDYFEKSYIYRSLVVPSTHFVSDCQIRIFS